METQIHKIQLDADMSKVVENINVFNRGSELTAYFRKQGFHYQIDTQEQADQLNFKVTVSPPLFHPIWRGMIEVKASGKVIPNDSGVAITFHIQPIWWEVIITYSVVIIAASIGILLGYLPSYFLVLALIVLCGGGLFEYTNSQRYIEELPGHIKKIF